MYSGIAHFIMRVQQDNNSLGGAFGALGGDLSAISINPASSTIFNDSEFGVTLKL